ncbi:MAG TPA: amino acid permease [Gemmataceae bacterium]|nr:amino acid permease [Gemmataceae bacterium]
MGATGDSNSQAVPSELDQVVAEVVREAHVQAEALRPEERQYLKEHALRKPMGVLHIWALGVGVVITGEYFGWNQGLKEGGPVGMLLASLFVCALYLMWVLALSELSVAMPFAGGPLAYGRRAVGPGFGFIMGWSMFLEALFATIGTAIATGGYIYYVLSLFAGGLDEKLVTTCAGLATVAVFALVQWLGSGLQARLMEWMTYGAIVGLVWFWIACIPGVRLERILTEPLLTDGWAGVLKAIPFAIWWLVMIETVALAPEEAYDPHRTIPRGLTLAQITLVVLVLLTWFFAAGAGSDYRKTGADDMSYPLPFVYGEVWPKSTHLIIFSLVAIFGMIVSYNGMIYAVSRQSFALGRAGYLPRVLGHVHPVRRTPDVSILFWSVIVAGFVVWGYFNNEAVLVAVLTCNLTALIWYVLAMACLFILRRRDPHMPRPYKTPFYPVLPALVLLMSLFAAAVYGWLNKPVVLWLTLLLYAVGLAYYLGFARRRLISAAPEELAARAGHENKVQAHA